MHINLLILGTPTAHTNRGDRDIPNPAALHQSHTLNCVVRNTDQVLLLTFLLSDEDLKFVMATAFCAKLTNLWIK